MRSSGNLGDDTIRCRVCGHGDAEPLGQIPDCGEFAGQQVSPSIKGGWLWCCRDCGSMFRYPTLSSTDYISLYEKAPSTVWVEGGTDRNDFVTIYTYLKNHHGGSILDVGCYVGDFLAGLPDRFKGYGIEPSDLASKSAASKGIEVLGKTLDELDSDKVFDVVVSIDVVEHVLDVEKFLGQSLVHVKENGLLIISTGNPGCFFWRKIFKSRFWYNSYPEHLVFPSFKYFCEFAKRHDLPLPEQICFKYVDIHFRASFFGFLRQIVFAISPVMHRAFISLRRSMKGIAIPMAANIPLGTPGVFTDHQAVIFRKRGQQWNLAEKV